MQMQDRIERRYVNNNNITVNRMRQLSRSRVMFSLVLNLLATGFVVGFLFDHHQTSSRVKSPALFHRSRTIGSNFQEHLRMRQWSSSSDDDFTEKQHDNRDGISSHILTVSYENSLATVRVFRNETILAALERSPEVAVQLGLPGCALPFDCRRGNCLTCAAQHLPGSQVSNLQPATSVNAAPGAVVVGDGLSPGMSKLVKDMGYALTCSSTITGDGVSIRLNVNDQAWQDLYRIRLEDEEQTRQIARKAVAQMMRRSAERNVFAWAQQTEEAFKKSISADDL